MSQHEKIDTMKKKIGHAFRTSSNYNEPSQNVVDIPIFTVPLTMPSDAIRIEHANFRL